MSTAHINSRGLKVRKKVIPGHPSGGWSAVAAGSKSPGRIGLIHPALTGQLFLNTPYLK